MKIAGFQKLTVQDYPNHLAALIFTQGCNFKCSYCHNSQLINYGQDKLIDEEIVLEYLRKRQNILDGLVITGGEPLIQNDIINFISKVKALKLKVKIDTNGFSPNILKKLIDGELIDYIAMDIKSDFLSYEKITGVKNIDVEKIKNSIQLIINSGINYEFRTTIIKNYHNINTIKKIASYLGKDVKYNLQNFEDNEFVLDKKLIAFTKEELIEIKKEVNKDFPNVKIRGID